MKNAKNFTCDFCDFESRSRKLFPGPFGVFAFKVPSFLCNRPDRKMGLWTTLLPRLLLLLSILALQAECATGNRKAKAGTAVRDAATICTPPPLCRPSHHTPPKGKPQSVLPLVDEDKRCSEIPRALDARNASLVMLAVTACSCPSRPSLERGKTG